MFTSRQTKHFRKLFDSLPDDVQRQARAAYKLFQENPQHPSLNFKPVPTAGANAYSAMIGEHYRVLGDLEGETIYWYWIGTHGVPRIGPRKDSCETQGRLRANASRAMSGA